MNKARSIKLLREKKGLSQRELATKAGCAPSYISTIESGSLEPSVTLLKKIAEALEVSEDLIYLLAIDQDSFENTLVQDQLFVLQATVAKLI